MATQKLTIRREIPWDVPLGVVALALGAVGLWLVFQTHYWDKLVRGDRDTPKVGSLSYLGGGVRHRPQTSPFWHDVTGEQKVAQGDTVFTGVNGTAKLKIRGAQEITLSPNSLIVVKAPEKLPVTKEVRKKSLYDRFVTPVFKKKERAVLKLDKGNVKVDVSKAGAPVLLEIEGKKYEIGLTDAAKKKQGTVEVSVDEGQKGKTLHVSTSDSADVFLRDVEKGEKGKDVVLAANQSVVVKSGKTRVYDNYVELTQPANGVRQLKPRNPFDEVDITFRWKWMNKSPDRSYVVINGKKAKRERIRHAQNKLDLSLPAGYYTWHVETVTGKTTVKTKKWAFSLSQFATPEILGPGHEASFETPADKKHRTRLMWMPLANETQAEIEIQEKNGEKQTLQGLKNGLNLPLPGGEYQWRVRTIGPKNVKSRWSRKRTFKITEIQVAAAPSTAPNATSGIKILQSVAVGKKTRKAAFKQASGVASTRLGSGASLSEISVALNWEPIAGVASYNVAVYDNAGKKVQGKQVTDSSFIFLVTSLNETSYQYEVSATLPNGKQVKSPRTPIQIALSSPIPKSPTNGSRFDLGAELLLTWEKTALTENYQIQISTNPKFRKPVLDTQLDDNFSPYTPRRRARYYWRIKSLSYGKKSQWSRTGTFRIQ